MSLKAFAIFGCLWAFAAVSCNQLVFAEEQDVDALETKTVASIASPGESFELIVVSPDGKLVATTSGIFSKSVELWDAATGKQLGSLPNVKDQVNCLAFTPDGKTIITGDGVGTVAVWDVATRKLKKKFKATLDSVKESGSMISALAVSSDGKIVYVAEIKHAPGIWDVAKAKRIVKDREAEGSPTALSLAPKSQILVAAVRGLRLSDPKTGKERKSIPLEGGTVRTMRFSPDEKLLAVGHDLGLVLIDVSSGKATVLDDINGHPAVAFSNDGRTLIAYRHSAISTWDVESGKKQAAIEIKRETAADTKGAMSADGSIVAFPISKTKLDVYEIPAVKSKK